MNTTPLLFLELLLFTTPLPSSFWQSALIITRAAISYVIWPLWRPFILKSIPLSRMSHLLILLMESAVAILQILPAPSPTDLFGIICLLLLPPPFHRCPPPIRLPMHPRYLFYRKHPPYTQQPRSTHTLTWALPSFPSQNMSLLCTTTFLSSIMSLVLLSSQAKWSVSSIVIRVDGGMVNLVAAVSDLALLAGNHLPQSISVR